MLRISLNIEDQIERGDFSSASILSGGKFSVLCSFQQLRWSWQAFTFVVKRGKMYVKTVAPAQ